MIYLELFIEFFIIGLFTFGGGYAMIPLMKDACLKNEWLSESRFLDYLGISEMTPGPISVNMATFIGSENGGLLGAIIATLGVIFPAFIIMVLISTFLTNLLKNDSVKAFLKGVLPIVIGLIIYAGISLCITVFDITLSFKEINFIPILIFLIILLTNLIYKKYKRRDLSPIIIIILGALLGFISIFIY